MRAVRSGFSAEKLLSNAEINLHGPTDGASKEELENDRDVEPAFRGSDM